MLLHHGILLDALHQLSAKGNTLVVVEHDEDTIRRAEHLIDIGPGAGVRGGRLIAQGSVADLAAAPESATGRYLRQAMRHPLHPRREVNWPASVQEASQAVRSGAGKGQPPAAARMAQALQTLGDFPVGSEPGWLWLQNASLHNLRHINAALPLKRLVAVTGVSGSGKSTFAR